MCKLEYRILYTERCILYPSLMITRPRLIRIYQTVSRDISSLGSFIAHIIIISAVYISNLDQLLTKQLALNFLATIIVCYIIRLVHFSERPNKRSTNTFLERLDASSFPSAHACRSFGAAVIAGNYLGSPYTVFFMILAFLISHSRVVIKEHHPRDIIAGTAIGIVLGMGIINFV